MFLRKDVCIIGFDLAWQLKLLYQSCGFAIQCKLWDVSVADWLLNPRDGKTALKQLVSYHNYLFTLFIYEGLEKGSSFQI